MLLMEAVNIQRATVVYADGILECLHAAFAPYQPAYTAGAFEDTVLTREALLRRLDEMTVLVALDPADCVIGTVAYRMSDQAEGHLRGMAVRPECQSLGIADQLLARAEADIVNARCSRISLDTTEPLQRAMRFYERHGYRLSGRTQNFFGMLLIEYVKIITPGD